MEINKKHLGSIVTINKITFNTLTAKPIHYQFYYDNGFAHLFVVEEVTEEVIPTPKKNASKKQNK
jgi:hypothetical protein